MSKELISIFAALLVLLVFAFIESLRHVGKVQLMTRMGEQPELNRHRALSVSNSTFGTMCNRVLGKSVDDNTFTKIATFLGINVDLLQHKIELLGKEEEISVVEIIVLKVIGIFCGVLIAIWAFSAKSMILAILGFIVFVALFMIPADKINDEIKERENRIQGELPNFISQVYMCIESGAPLREALMTVSTKTGGYVGKAVLDAFLAAQYSGRWEEELSQMARGMQVEALEDFVTDILIASQKGTSVSETLRSEVEHINKLEKARQKERVASLNSKMLLPMVVFFLLPIFAIVLLPALLQAAELLK